MFKIAILISLSFVALSACQNETADTNSDEPRSTADQALWAESGRGIWGSKEMKVCFVHDTYVNASYATLRDSIQTWIQGDIGGRVDLNFTDWGDCGSRSDKYLTRVTIGPAGGGGRTISNFNATETTRADITLGYAVGKGTVLHEFVHALGFPHEWERVGGEECTASSKKTPAVAYTDYDHDSVTNRSYCNDVPEFSSLDVLGLQKAFGARNVAYMSSVYSIQRGHAELFRRGSDGYLNYFFVSPNWIKDDQSFRSVRVAGDVSAVYAQQSATWGHSEVFFVGDDGYLHQYFVPESEPRWHHDSSSFVGAGNLTGHVSATYSQTRGHSEVFVRGEDGRLNFFFFDGGQWQRDPENPGRGDTVSGDIAAVYSPRPGRNHSEVFYVAQDGLLHYSYVEANGWRQDKIHFSAAGRITGRVAAVYSEARQHSEVFARGEDGYLHYFFVNENGEWAHDSNHFLEAGQITGEVSTAYSPVRQHSEVLVTGLDGRLHYFYLSGQQWAHDSSHFDAAGLVAGDLTAVFAPHVAGCPQQAHTEFFYLSNGFPQYYFVNSNGWAHDGGSFL